MTLQYKHEIKNEQQQKEIWDVLKPHLDELIEINGYEWSDIPIDQNVFFMFYPEETRDENGRPCWEIQIDLCHGEDDLFSCVVPHDDDLSIAFSQLFNLANNERPNQSVHDAIDGAQEFFSPKIKKNVYALINQTYYVYAKGTHMGLIISASTSRRKVSYARNIVMMVGPIIDALLHFYDTPAKKS